MNRKPETSGILDSTTGAEVLGRSGIQNTGYLTKKGLKPDAPTNELPPGQDPDVQKNADIRDLRYREYSRGNSFEGDGRVKTRPKKPG
jgi:hypothetical protein